MDGDVLAILITVRNAQAAAQQIQGVENALEGAASAARRTAVVFGILYTATRFLMAVMRDAGEDESMRLQLQALTHSASIAQSQMQAIRAESERGLFDKQELFEARKVFNETGTSIKELLPLSEELAKRSGKGLDATARIFASLDSGGMGRLGAVLRAAGLSVNALRGAGLDVTKTYQVKSSPQQTLKALKEVLSKDSLTGALDGSLSASSKGAIAALTDLFRSIGDGLMPFIKPVLSFLTGILRLITQLNDLTGGWMTNILLAVAAFAGIAKILPLIEALVGWEELAFWWQAALIALNEPWAAIAAGIGLVIKAIKSLTSVTQIQVAWQAVLDALENNWIAITSAVAVAAAVGVAVHFSNEAAEEKDAPAEKPVRRSDIENAMQRSRARAFS